MSKAFNSIKDKITQYLQLRFDQLRLEVVERLVNVLGYFIFIIFMMFVSILGLIFLALGLSEWLITLLDSRVLGMFATAGIFIFFALFLALISKSIVRLFAGKMAAILLKKRSKKKWKNRNLD